MTRETAVKAIEAWRANPATTFTPANILREFGDDILTALRDPAPQASEPAEAEAGKLADWILSYLENECALDPGCVAKSDRHNVANAVLNSVTGYMPHDLLRAGRELLDSPGIARIRVKSQGNDLLDRDEVFRRIIDGRLAAPLPHSAASTAEPAADPGTIVAPYNPCLAKLRVGEPFFVLLGRDKQAPEAVTCWANARERAEGKTAWTEQAREIAAEMATYSGAAPTTSPLPTSLQKAQTSPEPEPDAVVTAIREACDLLAERTYGNPARSPAHNARVRLETALKLATVSRPAHGEDKRLFDPTSHEESPPCTVPDPEDDHPIARNDRQTEGRDHG